MTNSSHSSSRAWRRNSSAATCRAYTSGDTHTRRERDRKGILDFVGEDATRVRNMLGAADQRKLDEYLTGVRELERRIVLAQPTVEVGQAKFSKPVGVPAD